MSDDYDSGLQRSALELWREREEIDDGNLNRDKEIHDKVEH